MCTAKLTLAFDLASSEGLQCCAMLYFKEFLRFALLRLVGVVNELALLAGRIFGLNGQLAAIPGIQSKSTRKARWQRRLAARTIGGG
jgi:hypothetical protein